MNREQQLEEAIKSAIKLIDDFGPCPRGPIDKALLTLTQAIEPPFVPKVGQVAMFRESEDDMYLPEIFERITDEGDYWTSNGIKNCCRPLTKEEKGE